MKANINFYHPNEKHPREWQHIVVVSGGDVFSGFVFEGAFHVLDSDRAFPFDSGNVDYWALSDQITGALFNC